MWDDPGLTVRRLPTDNDGLSEFLSRVQPGSQDLDRVTDAAPGLLVIAGPEDEQTQASYTTHHLHMLKEDYFKCDWPKDVRVIDERDAVHRQGWAYVQVRGHIGTDTVFGDGQVPLIYSAYRDHPPRLRLQVGHRLLIVDDELDTFMYSTADRVKRSYPRGSFFEGLSRPWMGLHSIDTVRRDAAAQHVWFKTRLSPDRSVGMVRLDLPRGSVVYTIDMNRDLVTAVEFEWPNGYGQLTKASLEFTYLERASQEEAFLTVRPRRREAAEASMGMLWLPQLAR
jgi:hypothetical protein